MDEDKIKKSFKRVKKDIHLLKKTIVFFAIALLLTAASILIGHI